MIREQHAPVPVWWMRTVLLLVVFSILCLPVGYTAGRKALEDLGELMQQYQTAILRAYFGQ